LTVKPKKTYYLFPRTFFYGQTRSRFPPGKVGWIHNPPQNKCLTFFSTRGNLHQQLAETKNSKSIMPYVNVNITRDGVTKSQKDQIVRDITHSLVKTLGKKPEHIYIVIDEVETDNWGFAGMLTTEYRKKAK